MIHKELKTREEAYLEFSDEEMLELGLSKGDKFTFKPQEDGSVFLEKWKEIDIDFQEFEKENLIALISHSLENECTINESLNTILKEYLDNNG